MEGLSQHIATAAGTRPQHWVIALSIIPESKHPLELQWYGFPDHTPCKEAYHPIEHFGGGVWKSYSCGTIRNQYQGQISHMEALLHECKLMQAKVHDRVADLSPHDLLSSCKSTTTEHLAEVLSRGKMLFDRVLPFGWCRIERRLCLADARWQTCVDACAVHFMREERKHRKDKLVSQGGLIESGDSS
eukprot:5855930-Amphidinium_carterae.3